VLGIYARSFERRSRSWQSDLFRRVPLRSYFFAPSVDARRGERVVVRLNKDCTRLQSFVVESRRLWASSGHHGGEGRRPVAVASLGGEISSHCRFVLLLFLWLAGMAREERAVTRLPQDLERRQWCCALSEQNLNGSFAVDIQSSWAAAPVLQELYFDTSSTIRCRPRAKIYGCRAAAPSLPVGVR
jgi:hypothetical protein